jgi:RNA polymerase sigma-70 factor (ECF subfamily)
MKHIEPRLAEPPVAVSLAEAYERLYRPMVAVAWSICRSQVAAHDVVQDAFARVLASRTARPTATAAFDAWVATIVRREAIRWLRRERLRLGLRPHKLSAERSHRPDDAFGGRRVLDEVQRLPRRQREIVFLHYFADLRQSEIASLLSIREGTVAASLHHARRTLEKGLRDENR